MTRASAAAGRHVLVVEDGLLSASALAAEGAKVVGRWRPVSHAPRLIGRAERLDGAATDINP